MSHKQFIVSDTNPNDTAGSGGCVCDPIKQVDCKPPYVVFLASESDNYYTPHTVICAECAGAAFKACSGEVLASGENSGAPRVENPHLLREYAAERLATYAGLTGTDDEDDEPGI